MEGVIVLYWMIWIHRTSLRHCNFVFLTSADIGSEYMIPQALLCASSLEHKYHFSDFELLGIAVLQTFSEYTVGGIDCIAGDRGKMSFSHGREDLQSFTEFIPCRFYLRQ